MNSDAVKNMNATQPMTAYAPVSAHANSNAARASASSDQVPVKTPDQAVQQAVQTLQTHMLGMDNALEFHVDNKTHATIVTVRDKVSGDIIRQMPSEEALWLAENLDKLTGALVRTSA